MFKPDTEALKNLIRWGNNVAAARAGSDQRLREAARDAATDGLVRALAKYQEGSGTPFDAFAQQVMKDEIVSRIRRTRGRLAAEVRVLRLDAERDEANSEA